MPENQFAVGWYWLHHFTSGMCMRVARCDNGIPGVRFLTAMVGAPCWALMWCSLVATQANEQSHEANSLPINTGAGGLLRNDDYRTRGMLAADAMFSAPVSRSIRWGISTSLQGELATTDDCVFRKSTGECLPRAPELVVISGLIGRVWQLGSASSGWSFRTYAGPSLVQVHTRAGQQPERWRTVGGATGRLEVLKHVATHVDLFATLRASFIPGLPRDARGVHAVGLGMGVH